MLFDIYLCCEASTSCWSLNGERVLPTLSQPVWISESGQGFLSSAFRNLVGNWGNWLRKKRDHKQQDNDQCPWTCVPRIKKLLLLTPLAAMRSITGSPTDVYQPSISFSWIARLLCKFTSLFSPPESEELTEILHTESIILGVWEVLCFQRNNEWASTWFFCQALQRECPSGSALWIFDKSENTLPYLLFRVPKHS